VRSLATNQVSIRRGAHAEANGAVPYSLALLTKGGEEEMFVGDHLQVRTVEPSLIDSNPSA